MKKQTAMALAAVFAMSVAGTALAAPTNPFVDVPAKHWSYDSINQLAKAGVISGYGDGSYQGDKTLTRYEAATLVAKAMTNADKLNPENKKALEALKTEFGTELNNLGVRISELEKNTGKIKITGEIRERYDHQKDARVGDNSVRNTRIRLFMTAPVAENIAFNGMLESESKWGNEDTNNIVKLRRAYITGKSGELDFNFGRQPIFLGQGLIADISGDCDGLFVSGGKDLKLAGAAFQNGTKSFVAANMDAKIAKNLNVTVSYLKDKQGQSYNTVAAGFQYTGLANVTVIGEYAQNNATGAKNANNNSKAKGWMGKIKYLGAQGDKVGSMGVWAGYRKADSGFDPSALTTLDSAILDGDNTAGKVLDDIKGPEYGVEYTVFKNGILTLQYNDLKTVKGTQVSKKNFFAHLVYSF